MTGRPSLLVGQTPLRIATLSDWHIGAGHGEPGSLNAMVRRDAEDLPYVPGTTVTGVLRDACLTVARALDGGTPDGRWQGWHRYAFGDAGDHDVGRATRRLAPATVTIGPARLPAALRRELVGSERLRNATTLVRVSVEIDQKLGRARDRALRFTEVATGGLPLHADLAADLPDDDARTAVTALLALGCAWCTELGGDRRRGLGRVQLRLGTEQRPHSPAEWAAWLYETGWEPPVPRRRTAPAPAAPQPRPAPLSTSDGAGWTVVDLVIVTEAPLRVPRQTLGNVVRGHDYLPGSVLLPWLSDRCGAGTVRSAVAAGQLVVRNAVPEVGGERGVPAPLALSRSRGAADENGHQPLAVGQPPKGFRQVRDRWTVATPTDGVVWLQQPALAQVSHNAVDRARQRPTAAAGVYELEVIPAGRTLRSQLLLAPAVVAQLAADHGARWWQRLDGPARFGARRRGEYGAARVRAARSGPASAPTVPPGPVTLWAASDLLIRGPGLRYSADPQDLRTALARQLGVPVDVEVLAARTRRRDSWHGGWQLPRETMTGLAAGTVVRITVAQGQQVAPDRWQQLLQRGVGDRTAEGFGEVLLNAPLLAATGWDVEELLPARVSAPTSGELTGECTAALQLLTERDAQRRCVDAVAAARTSPAYARVRAAFAALSPSQRGTWLALAASAAVARSTRVVREHAEAWLPIKKPNRAAQVALARIVAGLLSDGAGTSLAALLAEPDLDLGADRVRARALAVLVADIVDGLRREPDEEDGS